MRKTILMILVVLLWTVSSAVAAPLKVGDKAPNFNLKDATGQAWNLDAPAWKGKVLLFNCLPSEEGKTNAAITTAVNADKGIDQVKLYSGVGIFSAPSAAAKGALRSTMKASGKVYLIDDDDKILGLWGLKPMTSNIVVLDKKRVVRFINMGKVPDAEIPKLMALVKTLQAEK
jgi:predicted transcriptional regulator